MTQIDYVGGARRANEIQLDAFVAYFRRWVRVADAASGSVAFQLGDADGETSLVASNQAGRAVLTVLSDGTLRTTGATSGTMSVIAPAVAGDNSLYWPSGSGTLARMEDITAAVSGTIHYIPKFTGANAIGDSAYSISGGVLLTTQSSGALTVVPGSGAALATVAATGVTTGQVKLVAFGVNQGSIHLESESGATVATIDFYADSGVDHLGPSGFHSYWTVSQFSLDGDGEQSFVLQDSSSDRMRLRVNNGGENMLMSNTTIQVRDLAHSAWQSIELADAALNGNLTFTGNTRRIIGDFSNAVMSRRTAFQGTAANTTVGILPGSGLTGSWLRFHTGSDASNTQMAQIGMSSAAVYISAYLMTADVASGTSLGIEFQTSSANRMFISPSGGIRLSSTLGATPTVVSDAAGNLQLDASLGFTNTGAKIVANMDHATLANRIRFSPSVTNANAYLQIVPDGTGNIGIVRVYGGSDPDNAPFGQINCTVASGAVFIASNKTGTGTTLPMYFTIGGLTAMVLSLNRSVWIGRTTVGVLTDAVGNVEVEGSVSVLTSTVHRAAAAPGSPIDGQLHNDSTQKALVAYVAGVKQPLVGCIFTGTADASVGNTTTDTSIMPTGVGTKTLPANFWVVGKTLRLTFKGKMSRGTTSVTRQYTLLLGATTIKSATTSAATTALTDDYWFFDCLITCRSVGVTGTVYAQMRHFGYAASDPVLVGTATVTIDTTASAAIDYKFKWSANDASNNMVLTNCTIEALN